MDKTQKRERKKNVIFFAHHFLFSVIAKYILITECYLGPKAEIYFEKNWKSLKCAGSFNLPHEASKLIMLCRPVSFVAHYYISANKRVPGCTAAHIHQEALGQPCK